MVELFVPSTLENFNGVDVIEEVTGALLDELDLFSNAASGPGEVLIASDLLAGDMLKTPGSLLDLTRFKPSDLRFLYKTLVLRPFALIGRVALFVKTFLDDSSLIIFIERKINRYTYLG